MFWTIIKGIIAFAKKMKNDVLIAGGNKKPPVEKPSLMQKLANKAKEKFLGKKSDD